MGADFEILLYLAKSGLYVPLNTSTSKISKEVKLSQQSVSRILIDMEKKGLIKRNVKVNGQTISIDAKGMELLQSKKELLNKVFSARQNLIVKGRIESGIGEGKYYMSIKGYKSEIKKRFDFLPYPGTLNLRIKEEDLSKVYNSPFSVIEGFSTKKRTYGSLKCKKVMINDNINGAIIIPERTSHPNNIVEIISDVHLRDRLQLKDDDELKFRLN
jgi:riboflavin kinase